jgi:hypothetical protein
MAYATAAPAAAPNSAPRIVLPVLSPESVAAGGVVAWGTAAGADTVLATLGAFGATDSGFAAGTASAGTGTACGAELRALTGLLLSPRP